MTEVRVGTRGDSLVIERAASARGLIVTLQSDGLLAASRPRDDYDLRGLADYFADLAAHAPADSDERKQWESLEGDIQLVARCRDRHVTITALLRHQRVDPGNDGWNVQLDIDLDPGEELLQAVSDVQNLLGSE